MRKLKKSLKLIISLVCVFALAVATVVTVVVVGNLRKKDDGGDNIVYSLTEKQKSLVGEIGADVTSGDSEGKYSAVEYSQKYSTIKPNVGDWKYLDESVAWLGTSEGGYSIYTFAEDDSNKNFITALKQKLSLDVDDDAIVVLSALDNHFLVQISNSDTYSFVICSVEDYEIVVNKKIDGVSKTSEGFMLDSNKFGCTIGSYYFVVYSNSKFEFFEYLNSYDNYDTFSFDTSSFESFSIDGNVFKLDGNRKVVFSNSEFSEINESSASESAGIGIGNYLFKTTKTVSNSNALKSVLEDDVYYLYSYSVVSKTSSGSSQTLNIGDFSKAKVVYSGENFFGVFMQKVDSKHALQTNGELVYFDYSLNEVLRISAKSENVKIIYSDGTYVLTSQGLFAGKNSVKLNLVFDFNGSNLTYFDILNSGNYLLKDSQNNIYVYNFKQDTAISIAMDEIVAYPDDNSVIFSKNGYFYIYYLSTNTVTEINYVDESNLLSKTSLFLVSEDDGTYSLRTSKKVVLSGIKTFDVSENHITCTYEKDGGGEASITYFFVKSGSDFSGNSVASYSSNSSSVSYGATASSSSTVEWYDYEDKVYAENMATYNGMDYSSDQYYNFAYTVSHCWTEGIYSNTNYYDYLEIDYLTGMGKSQKGGNYEPLRLYYTVKVNSSGDPYFGFYSASYAGSYLGHHKMALIDITGYSSLSSTVFKSANIIQDGEKTYYLMPIEDFQNSDSFVVREYTGDKYTDYDLESYGNLNASRNSYDYVTSSTSGTSYCYFFDQPIYQPTGRVMRGIFISKSEVAVYGESIKVTFKIQFIYKKECLTDDSGNSLYEPQMVTMQKLDGSEIEAPDIRFSWGQLSLEDDTLKFVLGDEMDSKRLQNLSSRYILRYYEDVEDYEFALESPNYYSDLYIKPVVVSVNKGNVVNYTDLMDFIYSQGAGSTKKTDTNIVTTSFVDAILKDFSSNSLYSGVNLYATLNGRDVNSFYIASINKKTTYTSGLPLVDEDGYILQDENGNTVYDYSTIYLGGFAATEVVGGKLIGLTSLNQTSYTATQSATLYNSTLGTYVDSMVEVNLSGNNGLQSTESEEPEYSEGSSEGNVTISKINNQFGLSNIGLGCVYDEKTKTLQYRSATSLYQSGGLNGYRYIYCVYEPITIEFEIDYNIGAVCDSTDDVDTKNSKTEYNTSNKSAWGELDYLNNYVGLTIGSSTNNGYYTEFKNTWAHLLDQNAFNEFVSNESGEKNKYVTVDFLNKFTRLSLDNNAFYSYVKCEDSSGEKTYKLTYGKNDDEFLTFDKLFVDCNNYVKFDHGNYCLTFGSDTSNYYLVLYEKKPPSSENEAEGANYSVAGDIDSDFKNEDVDIGGDSNSYTNYYVFYNNYDSIQKYVKKERDTFQKTVIKQLVLQGEVFSYFEIDGQRFYFQRNYSVEEKTETKLVYSAVGGDVKPDDNLFGENVKIETKILNYNKSFTNLGSGSFLIATTNFNMFYPSDFNVEEEDIGEDDIVFNGQKIDGVEEFLATYKNYNLRNYDKEYGIMFYYGSNILSDGYRLFNQFFPNSGEGLEEEYFSEVQDNFYYTPGDTQLVFNLYQEADGTWYAYYHQSSVHEREAEYKGNWEWKYTSSDNTNNGLIDITVKKSNAPTISSDKDTYTVKETFTYRYTDLVVFTSAPTHLHYTSSSMDAYYVSYYYDENGDIQTSLTYIKTIFFAMLSSKQFNISTIIDTYIDANGSAPENFSKVLFKVNWEPIDVDVQAIMWTTESAASDSEKKYDGLRYGVKEGESEYKVYKTTISTSKNAPKFMIGANKISIIEQELTDKDGASLNSTIGYVNLTLTLEYSPYLTYSRVGEMVEDNGYNAANISVTGINHQFAGWVFAGEVTTGTGASTRTETVYYRVSGLFGIDEGIKNKIVEVGSSKTVMLYAIYTGLPYDFDLYFNPMGGAQKENGNKTSSATGTSIDMNSDPISIDYDITVEQSFGSESTNTFKYTTKENLIVGTKNLGFIGDNTNYQILYTNNFYMGSSVKITTTLENDYYYFRKIVINNIILKNDAGKYDKYTLTFECSFTSASEAGGGASEITYSKNIISENAGNIIEGGTEAKKWYWIATAMGENSGELKVTAGENGLFMFGSQDEGKQYNNENNTFKIEMSNTSTGSTSKKQMILTIGGLSWGGTLNYETQEIAQGRGFTAEFYPASYTISNEDVTIKTVDENGKELDETYYLNRTSLVSAQPLTNLRGKVATEGEGAYIWLNTSRYCFSKKWVREKTSGYYRVYSVGLSEPVKISDYTYEMFVTQNLVPNGDIYVYFDDKTNLVYYLSDTQMEYYNVIEEMVQMSAEADEKGLYCNIELESGTTYKYYAFYKGSNCETLPEIDEIVDQYLLFMREDAIVEGVGYASMNYGREIYMNSFYSEGSTSFYGRIQTIKSYKESTSPTYSFPSSFEGEGINSQLTNTIVLDGGGTSGGGSSGGGSGSIKYDVYDNYFVSFYIRSIDQAQMAVSFENSDSNISSYCKNRYIYVDDKKFYLNYNLSSIVDGFKFANEIQTGAVFKACSKDSIESQGLTSYTSGKLDVSEYTKTSDTPYIKGNDEIIVQVCSSSDNSLFVKYYLNQSYSEDEVEVVDSSTVGKKYRNEKFDEGKFSPSGAGYSTMNIRIYYDIFSNYIIRRGATDSTFAMVSINTSSDGTVLLKANESIGIYSLEIIFDLGDTSKGEGGKDYVTAKVHESKHSMSYTILNKVPVSDFVNKEGVYSNWNCSGSITNELLVVQANQTTPNEGYYAKVIANQPQVKAKTTYTFMLGGTTYYLLDKTENGIKNDNALDPVKHNGKVFKAYRGAFINSSAVLQQYTSKTVINDLDPYSKACNVLDVLLTYDDSKGVWTAHYLVLVEDEKEQFYVSFNNTRVMTIDPEQNSLRSATSTSSNSLLVTNYYEIKYYISEIQIGTTKFTFKKITRKRSDLDATNLTYSYKNFEMNADSIDAGTINHLTSMVNKTFVYFGETYTINDAYTLSLSSADQNDAGKIGAKTYKFYLARTNYGYTRYFLIYDEYTKDLSQIDNNYDISISFTKLENEIEINLTEEDLYGINTGSSGNSLYVGGMFYEGSTADIPTYSYNLKYLFSDFVDASGEINDYQTGTGADAETVEFEYNTFYEYGKTHSSFSHSSGGDITYSNELTSLKWKALIKYNPSNTAYYRIYARSGYLIKSFKIFVGEPKAEGSGYYLQNVISFELDESTAFERLYYSSDAGNYTYSPANNVTPNLVYSIKLSHILCDEKGNPILDADNNYTYYTGSANNNGSKKNYGYSADTVDGSKVGLWYSNMTDYAWTEYKDQDNSGTYCLDDIYLLISGLYEDIRIDITTTSYAEFVFEDSAGLLLKDTITAPADKDYVDIKISQTHLNIYSQEAEVDENGNVVLNPDGSVVTKRNDTNGFPFKKDRQEVTDDTLYGATAETPGGSSSGSISGETIGEEEIGGPSSSSDINDYPYVLRYYPSGTSGEEFTSPTGQVYSAGGLAAGTIRMIFIGTGSVLRYGLHIFATSENYSVYFSNARYYNQKTNDTYIYEIDTALQPPSYADAFKNLESYSGRTQDDEPINTNTLNKNNKMAYIFTGSIVKNGESNYFSDWFNQKIYNRTKFFVAMEVHDNDISLGMSSYLYNDNLTSTTNNSTEIKNSIKTNAHANSNFKYSIYENSESADNELLTIYDSNSRKYSTYQLDNTTKTQSWFNDKVLTNISFVKNYTTSLEGDSSWENSHDGNNWYDYNDSVSLAGYGYDFAFEYYEIAGYKLDKILVQLGDLTTYYIIDLNTLSYQENTTKTLSSDSTATEYRLIDASVTEDLDKVHTISMTSVSGYVFEFELYYTVKPSYSYYTLLLVSYERDDDGNLTYDKSGHKIIDNFKSVALMGCDIQVAFVSNALTYTTYFNSNVGDEVSTKNSYKIKQNSTNTTSNKSYDGTNADRCLYQEIYYDTLTKIDFSATLNGYTFIGWGNETYYTTSGRKSRYTAPENDTTPVTWNSSADWSNVVNFLIVTSISAQKNAKRFDEIYNDYNDGSEALPGSAFYVDGGYFMTDTGYHSSGTYQQNYNFFSNYICEFGGNIGKSATVDFATSNIVLYALYKANTYIIEFDVNNEVYNDKCYINSGARSSWNSIMLPGNLGFEYQRTTPRSYNEGSNRITQKTTDSHTYVAYVTFDTSNWYYVYKNNQNIEKITKNNSTGETVTTYSTSGDGDNVYSYADSSKGLNLMYSGSNVSNLIRVDMFGYSWLGWTYKKVDYSTSAYTSVASIRTVTVIQSEYSSTKSGGDGWQSTTPKFDKKFLRNARIENSVREISDEDKQNFYYKNQHKTIDWDMTNMGPTTYSNGYVYFYSYEGTDINLYGKSIGGKSADYLNIYNEDYYFKKENLNKTSSDLKIVFSYYDTCLNKNCYSIETVEYDDESYYQVKVTKNNDDLRLFTLFAAWEQNKYDVYAYANDSRFSTALMYNSSTEVIWGDKSNATELELGTHYFNNYSLAHDLYYTYRPTRIGYDFTGWTFAYAYMSEVGANYSNYSSINNPSDVVYLCGDLLDNYDIIYSYGSNSPTRSTILFVDDGESHADLLSNENGETLGDSDAVNGQTRYVYVYPVWQVQTFSINISLNISHEELENLYEKDSSFALGLYESSDYKEFTGISSKFYTNKTEIDTTNYADTGSNYNNYYGDIVANILFEIEFDSAIDTATLSFGGKTYKLADLFVSSAGYYFLGLTYKKLEASEVGTDAYVVRNTLKSALEHNSGSTVLTKVESAESGVTYKTNASDDVALFDLDFYNQVITYRYSATGSSESKQYAPYGSSGTYGLLWQTNKDKQGEDFYTKSSNFGYLSLLKQNIIKDNCFACENNYQMLSNSYSTTTYDYGIMSELVDGQYYLYALVNNQKYYIVYYNYDRSNIDNSITFDRTFLYYNKTEGGKTTKYTIRLDSGAHAYYVDNSYGNKTNLDLRIAIYTSRTNTLNLDASGNLITYDSATNGSIIGTDGKSLYSQLLEVGKTLNYFYRISREFTLFARYSIRNISTKIYNGNNAGGIKANSTSNYGLAGYYYIQTEVKGYESDGSGGYDDAHLSAQPVYEGHTGDDRAKFYSDVFYKISPYFQGRYLSEMTLEFDTLSETNSGVSSVFEMTHNILTFKFDWDNKNYVITITEVYLNGESIYNPVTEAVHKEDKYYLNKLSSSITVLSFLDKFGLTGYLNDGLKLYDYNKGGFSKCSDVNLVTLNLKNLMCSLDINCKFSVQTFEVEIYSLVTPKDNVKKIAETNQYRTSFNSYNALLLASNKNVENRTALGNPFISSVNFNQSYLATISTDCAYDKKSYNVPYGYYVNDAQTGSLNALAGNASYFGLDYIYSSSGKYYFGSTNDTYIRTNNNKSLDTIKNSSLGNFICWATYYGESGGDVIVDKYIGNNPITANLEIFGFYETSTSLSKQIQFYYWDNDTESYTQYTNNVKEYTLGGSKFISIDGKQRITELPSSSMASWYNESGKEMKFLGYVYIADAEFNTYKQILVSKGHYDDDTVESVLITDMFKKLLKPVDGSYKTTGMVINGINTTVLSSLTLKVPYSSTGTIDQELNVLNVDCNFTEAGNIIYAIAIYDEIRLSVNKFEMTGTLNLSQSYFSSCVFEYNTQYTIFYEIKDLRFVVTTSSSATISNFGLTSSIANKEVVFVLSLASTFSTYNYGFYNNTDIENHIADVNFGFNKTITATGSELVKIFFYYNKNSGSGNAYYPYYKGDNYIEAIVTNGVVTSARIYGGDEISSTNCILEENYSPLEKPLATSDYLTIFQEIDSKQITISATTQTELEKAYYEIYNRKLIIYIAKQLISSNYSSKVLISSGGYKSFGEGATNASNKNIKECIDSINGSGQIMVTDEGFFNLIYSIACYHVKATIGTTASTYLTFGIDMSSSSETIISDNSMNYDKTDAINSGDLLVGDKSGESYDIISIKRLGSSDAKSVTRSTTGTSKVRNVAMYIYDGKALYVSESSKTISSVDSWFYGYYYFTGDSNYAYFNIVDGKANTSVKFTYDIGILEGSSSAKEFTSMTNILASLSRFTYKKVYIGGAEKYYYYCSDDSTYYNFNKTGTAYADVSALKNAATSTFPDPEYLGTGVRKLEINGSTYYCGQFTSGANYATIAGIANKSTNEYYIGSSSTSGNKIYYTTDTKLKIYKKDLDKNYWVVGDYVTTSYINYF